MPKLKQLGYSDDEIAKFKEDNAKYFRGRLKVGGKWITTPFNAFSDRGMSNMGINPYLAAAKEVSTSTDSFGRPISGNESGFVRRVMSKFPQLELGRQFKLKRDVDAGRFKPSVKYIGKAGHDGFGLGKEKQGYDPTKPNYVPSMDPRQKLGSNALAFVGVPRAMEFDKQSFLKGKTLQKLSADYFSLDTKGMTFDNAEVERQKLFKKYGVSADEFYKGVLSKYDTENTTKIKAMKEDAKAQNDSYFAEYAAQPYGTRGAWAIKKLEELNKSGYFDSNPYLYSFVHSGSNPKGWIDPTAVNKIKTGQAKKADYNYAVRTGDWSKWAAKYGKSEKAKARDKAVATGDWSAYAAKYGVTKKETPFKYGGKFFKSADSMERYKEGEFWQKYSDATPEDRKKLIAENPQYNKRGNWTAAMWLADKKNRKAEQRSKAMSFSNISTLVTQNKAATEVKAIKFAATLHRRQKKVAFTRG